MNILEQLYENALAKYPRQQRRAIKRQALGVEGRKRSTRRCSVCRLVVPSYRLIVPEGREQMCLNCRDAELRGEVK